MERWSIASNIYEEDIKKGLYVLFIESFNTSASGLWGIIRSDLIDSNKTIDSDSAVAKLWLVHRNSFL